MKKTLLIALAVIVSGAFTTANAEKKGKKKQNVATPVETVTLKTSSDTLSYAAGKFHTEGLAPFLKSKYGIDEKDMDDVIRGVEDMLNTGLNNKSKAYAAGMQIAMMVDENMIPYRKQEFKNYKDSINTALFNKGFIASLKKDNSVLADSIAKSYFNNAVEDNKNTINMKRKKEGEMFLMENAKKEGVVTLPDGLQYKVLTAGTGAKPTDADRVVVKYEGKTIDGKVFDSSYKRNPQTTTFGVTQVIKGWTEALKLMPVGSKWEVYIPYNLAYGERGAGQQIKPYDALIFTVELVDIEKPKTETPEAKTKKADAAKTKTAKKAVRGKKK